MADTTVQREVAGWLREHWLSSKYRQAFTARRLLLSSGGTFEFDAVSQDGKIAATISTSQSLTAGGKQGSGKPQKIRADALFLLLAEVEEQILLFSEQDMFKLVEGEFERGRLPTNLKIMLANLPADLKNRLEESCRVGF